MILTTITLYSKGYSLDSLQHLGMPSYSKPSTVDSSPTSDIR